MNKKIDLMEGRWKVIADYPYCPYKIGDLVELSQTGTSFHCTTTKEYDPIWAETKDVENYFSILNIDKFPHLFRKLEWYEERQELEMPEYLIHKDTKVVYQRAFAIAGASVAQVRILDGKYGKATVGPIGLRNLLPATLEDYNQYLSSIHQTE